MTLEEARKIDRPMVYALTCKGEIVYIGKTANPKKRLYSYMNTDLCHNRELAEFLNRNKCLLSVISLDPKDLNSEEIKHIKKIKPEFNKISTNNAFVHKTKPWHAGIGVRCPSDYVMNIAARTNKVKPKDVFPEIYKLRENMSDIERSCFEVSVYRYTHEKIKEALQPWLNECRNRLLEVMSDGQTS
jgi:excinuclease UvrABC nuclease subunit